MKKWIKYLTIICLLCNCIQQPIIATSLSDSEENVRVKFNSDMKAIYSVGEEYYPLKDYSNKELHIYYKDQVRGGGESKFSHILCYGEPYGKNDGTVNEYLGTTKLGEGVPNPQYGWDSGWDGKPISKWGEIKPWEKRGLLSQYNDKQFNVPGIGMTTLENVIQTGVDLVYGGKTYNQIKGPKAPYSSYGDSLKVHTVGAKPAEGWIKYVHVVIPPTQDTWGGMKNGTYYMTAWTKDIDISKITRVPQMILKGINAPDTPIDYIPITVQGSMYDDLNNN